MTKKIIKSNPEHTDIQIRLKKVNKSQVFLSRKFNRSEPQISMALRGKYPTLKNKIIKYVEYLERGLRND